jgi:thiol-disulfide isomerase/thioredoxin
MGVSFLDKIFREVKSFCKGDETCILLLLLAVGFVLCSTFSDGFALNDDINDAPLGAAVEKGENVYGFGKDAPHTEAGEMGSISASVQGATLGLEPRSNRPSPVAPSLAPQMDILGPVQASTWNASPQKQGLLVQDGTIAEPFNEVWTPGYEPVDLAFKGALPLDNTKPPTDAAGSGTSGHLGGEGINLTLYYAPWCGHCKAMMPAFDEFQKKHHGTSIGSKVLNIFKVNSDEEPDKVKEAGVTGFPHVDINGDQHGEFPRKGPENMKTYVEGVVS